MKLVATMKSKTEVSESERRLFDSPVFINDIIKAIAALERQMEDIEEKSIEELRKEFEKSHWEWMAVWNPKGYSSGEVWKAWNTRTENVIRLARSLQIHQK